MNRRDYMKAYQKEYAKRVKRIKITFDKEDYKRLAAEARKCGMTPNSLMRHIVDEELAKDQTEAIAVAAELRVLISKVQAISRNLNMLAHHANTVKRVADLPAVYSELARLTQVVEDYCQRDDQRNDG